MRCLLIAAVLLAACVDDPITIGDAGPQGPDAGTSARDASVCAGTSCADAASDRDAHVEDARTSSAADAGAIDGGPSSGRRFAFASNRAGEYDIYVAHLAGGAPEKLTGNDGNDFYPSFSADGRHVIFSGARGMDVKIFSIDLTTRTTSEISTPGLSRASTPALSPDGCCVAFEGVRTGEFAPDIYLKRSDEAPVALTNDRFQDSAPVFSPDGSRIFFVSNRDGTFHVYSMATDGSDVVRETRTAGVLGRPAVSADGTRLAYARFDQARRVSFIVELTRGTSAERVISEMNDYEPTYATTGDLLLFGTARFLASEVMLLDLRAPGAPARRLTDDPSVDGQPAISP